MLKYGVKRANEGACEEYSVYMEASVNDLGEVGVDREIVVRKRD